MNEWSSTGLPIEDEVEFAAQVNDALKEYDSVLSLARLPLANSPLVTPLLVLNDVAPTTEERGQALRLLIRWAVERLAPAPALWPIGRERPFDDPTWSDSRWWRYNILRHRYLEPLHPDQFVEGGRYTETLIALTGIPSTDTFFDERNRAIREVGRWLRQQWLSGQANAELQQLALNEVYRPLEKQAAASHLLAIAATFDEVFPSQLLRQMAGEERVDPLESALPWLIQNRYLSSGEGGALLSLSSILQRDLYVRQPAAKLARRHRQIASWYLANQAIVAGVRHLQKAGHWQEAAAALLKSADDLINELQGRELTGLLRAFPAHSLPGEQWRDVQIRLSDMLALNGATEEAIAACRRALKVTDAPRLQACIYHRMGKLYEMHNQAHALNYYQQALERFSDADAELVDLLKDRAWVYILREEWEQAENDLNLALSQRLEIAARQRANIYDALSYLHGRQQQYALAIQYARQSLALREESGDLLRVADSFGILGLLYVRLGEYENARSAHQDSLKIYRQVDNRPKIAGALINIGMAFHLEKRLREAIASYDEALRLCVEIGLPLVQLRARSNLVEAYLDMQQTAEAQTHWRQGYALAVNKGLSDEIGYYEELRTKFPQLQAAIGADSTSMGDGAIETVANGSILPASALSPDEMAVLQFAQRRGHVTASDLIQQLHLSRATATRRLAGLVEKGHLQAAGKGRGSYYRPLEKTKIAQMAESALDLPRTETSVEALRVQLVRQRQELEQDFALAALGLVLPLETSLPFCRMVVRFRHLPDLSGYFALKERLSRLLQREVDLLPQGVATSQRFGDAEWLWGG